MIFPHKVRKTLCGHMRTITLPRVGFDQRPKLCPSGGPLEFDQILKRSTSLLETYLQYLTICMYCMTHTFRLSKVSLRHSSCQCRCMHNCLHVPYAFPFSPPYFVPN